MEQEETPRQIFISHAEEDKGIVEQLVVGLEAAGYTTWYYERDAVPGPSYMAQLSGAIEQAQAVVAVISPRMLDSNQVEGEVVHAFESRKPISPILSDISHAQVQQRLPALRQALGAAASISIPLEGVPSIIPRVVAGFMKLGVRPAQEPIGAPGITGTPQLAETLLGETAPATKPMLPEKKVEVGLEPLRRDWDRAGEWLHRSWGRVAAAVAGAIVVLGLIWLVRSVWPPPPLPTAEPTTVVAGTPTTVTSAPEPTWTPSSTPGLKETTTGTPSPTSNASVTPSRTPTPSRTASPTATSESDHIIPKSSTAPTPSPLIAGGTPLPQSLPPVAPANARQMGQLATLGKGRAGPLAHSVGGTRSLLAVGTSTGVLLCDPETLAELRLIPMAGPVRDVALSPDGTLLASASGTWDNTIKLWSMPDGHLLRTLEGHTSLVRCLAFSPDGSVLASGSDDKTVRLWQASTGSPIRTFAGHSGTVTGVAFGPDGHTLASVSSDKTVRLWALDEDDPMWIGEHAQGVSCLAFSPDGVTLATGSWDHLVWLWQVSSGSQIGQLRGHTGSVSSLAFSPDGKLLASGSDDQTVQLWRADEGTIVRTLDGDGGTVADILFGGDRQTLISSAHKKVTLWQLNDGKRLSALEGFTGGILYSVAFSRDGQTLAAGDESGIVWLWRPADGALMRTFQVVAGRSVRVLAFGPDDQVLAAATGLNHDIILVRPSDGLPLRVLKGSNNTVESLSFSPDGETLAAGVADGTVPLWRVNDGQLLRTLEGHTTSVKSVAFSHDGSLLASGSGDRTVRLWQTEGGTHLRTLEGLDYDVYTITFGPGDETLSACSGSTTRQWQVSTGELLRMVPSGCRDGGAFSPDGQILAAGYGSAVRLSSLLGGAILIDLEGHANTVESLAFSPDGTLLASGSWDGTVRLWGVAP